MHGTLVKIHANDNSYQHMSQKHISICDKESGFYMQKLDISHGSGKKTEPNATNKGVFMSEMLSIVLAVGNIVTGICFFIGLGFEISHDYLKARWA